LRLKDILRSKVLWYVIGGGVRLLVICQMISIIFVRRRNISLLLRFTFLFFVINIFLGIVNSPSRKRDKPKQGSVGVEGKLVEAVEHLCCLYDIHSVADVFLLCYFYYFFEVFAEKLVLI
jgi:hypothetical protein